MQRTHTLHLGGRAIQVTTPDFEAGYQQGRSRFQQMSASRQVLEAQEIVAFIHTQITHCAPPEESAGYIVGWIAALLSCPRRPEKGNTCSSREEHTKTRATDLSPAANEQKPVILLNAVHPSLATRYSLLHTLASALTLSIEETHEAIECFEVRSFTSMWATDTLCADLNTIEQDLLRIERDYGATLQELARTHRMILLVEGFISQPHIEFAMALALFVAAMSASSPRVLSVHYDPSNPDELEVMHDLRLDDLLSYYSTNELRKVIYPAQIRSSSDQKGGQPA